MPPSSSRDLTLLVDASSLIYRAFFAVPDTVRAPDGTPVNGAHGFIDMLARLIATYSPACLACAWDDDWRPQWRVDLIESYKAHRVAEDTEQVDDVLEKQVPVIAEVLELAGIAAIGCAGYEAEDVIGALVPHAPGPVAIVSGDRDLFQLVHDPDVWILYPRRGVSDLIVVNESYIAEKYGVPGRGYGDMAILRGDPSDGLPGVRGIGEKTAVSLIAKYGSLEAVIEASRGATSGPLAKVAAATDYLARAARVVRITDEAPIDTVECAVPLRDPDPSLQDVATRYGVSGPVERLRAALRALA